MVQDPDQDLVRRAKRGDKAAFGTLTQQYYEMVYVIAYGVLHNRESARDVTQNAFIKAFKEIKGFEEKAKFKSWLYRIAVNASLDEVRKKKPVDSIEASEEDEDRAPIVIADKSPSPRREVAQSELRDVMQRALKQLSPDHRAVLVLREWQELSYDEIATSLRIDIGTVMSRIHYARKKLGEVLKESYGMTLVSGSEDA